MEPTLEQVIEIIQENFGPYRKPIDGNSRVEEDLHICGDDGIDLLEACEQAFTISFDTEDNSFRNRFSLAEDEYLFTGEGLDLFGICRFVDWLRGIPKPVIRDITVGKLHRVIMEAVREQNRIERI